MFKIYLETLTQHPHRIDIIAINLVSRTNHDAHFVMGVGDQYKIVKLIDSMEFKNVKRQTGLIKFRYDLTFRAAKPQVLELAQKMASDNDLMLHLLGVQQLKPSTYYVEPIITFTRNYNNEEVCRIEYENEKYVVKED